jgi:AcrR family transcriptional regulator
MPKDTFLNLSEDKKNKIINAAKKEFSRVPIEEASIKNIVEEAGIARGSFYQYFESKEDLLEYILKSKSETLDTFLKERLGATNGDIFQVYIDMFDFMMKELLNSEDKAFFSMTIKNVRISDEKSVALGNLEKKKHKGHFPKEIFLSMVDKTKLKINNDEDLEIIVKMLYLITRKALVSSFKENSYQTVRKEYIQMVEYLKYGVLK